MNHSVVSVGIHGATGRMGTRLIQLIASDKTFKLAAALERSGHPRLGDDAGLVAGVGPLGVALDSSLPASSQLDVMIDFSLPEASLAIARLCTQRRIALVVGTTGFDAAARAALETVSESIPILIAPNMSRAVNLLMRLVREATRALGEGADIAIIERHHRTKKDAPSGTALKLAEVAREGLIAARPAGPGPHEVAQISMHALRIADSPGEHTVVFAMPGETIELSHRALNRDGFALGALEAAKFLVGKPAGRYTMENVLECP
jgi:4-hydroxy-tetrahydrodipicolinate reductase